MHIELSANTKELALEAVDYLAEDEVKEVQFGRNNGKFFISRKRELLVEPQTIEDTEKTVYVSLWKK